MRRADAITKESGDVGTIFHHLCERYLLSGYVDLERLLPLEPDAREFVLMLFEQARPVLDQLEVEATEIPLYSNDLRLAGTADCIAWYKGDLYIVDFKNSRRMKEREWIGDYFIQCSAYAKMLHEQYGMLAKKILIVMANWEGPLDIFEENVSSHYDNLIAVNKKYNPRWN